MSKHPWIRWVARSLSFVRSARTGHKAQARQWIVPRLEPLEERCVLTTLVGVTSTGTLVDFNSLTPGTLNTIAAVTGLASGQSLVALDFRPATGGLYGVGFNSGTTTGQLYTIDPTTAAATAVGTPFSTTLTGTIFDMDFDPVANQLRIVDNTEQNLRVNPDTGALLSVDTPLTAGLDVIAGLAYDRNFRGATATTAYGYDFTLNKLVTIGSINGSPNSANTGIVAAVGSSGVVAFQAGNLGFDIDADGVAYLNLVVSSNSGLWTQDLSTGEVFQVGNFPTGTFMTDIAAAPAVSFKLSPAPFIAGVPESFTVRALDAFGNSATAYQGTVAITSSDAAAVLPASAKLSNSVGTFTVTMNTPGAQTITASEQTTNAITKTVTVSVDVGTDLVGVTSTGNLVRFNSATPGTLTAIGAVTSLTAGQTLVGIDFRPKTGGLYGMGFNAATTTGQLYTINPLTAVATAVGTPFSTTLNAGDSAFGFGFDPVADQIRITSNTNENLRVNPDTGALAATDSNINPAADIVGLAYNNFFLGATQTTAYGYNFSNDHLETVGSINGAPNSPNTGTLTDIGTSGVVTTQANNLGFDISPDGTAYLNLAVGGGSGLYTENLATGTVGLVGGFTGVTMTDITVAPAVSFTVTGFPSPVDPNVAGTVTVTAKNVYGDTASGYQGTVAITSSDAAAVLPANSKLTQGSDTFTVRLETQGTQTITATDTLNSTITGSESVTVNQQPGVASITTTTSNGTYNVGAKINVTITFNKPVTLTGGNLNIVLNDNDTITIAPFSSATTTVTGIDTVTTGQNAQHLDSASITLTAGATLKDTNGANVLLTIPSGKSLANSSSITVNTMFNFDKLGAYRPSNGSWSLDSDGTFGFNGATDQVFFDFSPPGVTGVAGDWTGTGRDNVGDFSNGVWHLDLNGNGILDAGETFNFGQAGDQPVVGNWDGNPSGRSELGVFRTAPDGITGEFILDIANHRAMDSSNLVFTFGFGSDHIIVGDWTGNGTTKVGVFRDAKNFIAADAGDIVFSINENGDHATFTNFVFGLITDHVVIGDWNGNGVSKVAVYRDGSAGFNAPGVALFSLDTNGNLQFDAGIDSVFLYGLTTDQFVSGNWVVTPPLRPEGTIQAQFAANGPGPGGMAPLTAAQLEPVLQQAIAAWAANGANAAQLESVSVQIGTLDDNLLGWTSGNQITIDATADGWGWNTDTSSVAAGKMDLLTVVEHEFGHELGLSDVDPATHPGDLMASTLPTGTRRTIGG